ncbi:MAG: RnfABCDGE type electron transport complex subunit E [Methanosarcinales archaeon]|jgi:electron transport complex protein RnfE|nr:electron transport complex subunit RsxE [Methanosarcinales archaeon]MRG76148.1 RnfABCDGE type electron transport complex subunit E [ANME-2 cluster archaeon]NOR60321.1 RnfABCDGE type electron transport complex subunit E [Methanosarcinales archaeon]
MAEKTILGEYLRGIVKDNPVLALVLGLCPALAVTTSVENAIGMSGAALFVLLGSNIMVSALRKQIPPIIRIPMFIIIICTFVTIIDMVMEAYTPPLYKALGIFIPLIVVNCIIIGRAEAYAIKNNVKYSIVDAFGIGTGFLVVLVAIGAIRELLGTGAIVLFGFKLISIPIYSDTPATFMILPAGAFMTIGVLMALVNYNRIRKLKKGA